MGKKNDLFGHSFYANNFADDEMSNGGVRHVGYKLSRLG